jgi:hypothetical protein
MASGAPAAPGGQGAAGESPPPQQPPPTGNSVPFEDSSLPFFNRLFRTIGMAFTDPMKLFSNMADGDLGGPLIYGVLLQTVVIVISLVWNMMFNSLALIGGGIPADEYAIGAGVYILIMFLSPVFALIGMFISTALYHVALLILGDGQRGFGVTFRAIAYGNTPNLLAVIPFCGGFAGGIWSVVLIIVAGKVGHRTDAWRAILAYFLPTIVCCCLIFWLASTLGFLAALSN